MARADPGHVGGCPPRARRVHRAVPLLQHKTEAYWFYRFLSLVYDRWVNPLFWTPAMRTTALSAAGLDGRELRTLDVGAGTGFTTEGIVAARRRRLRDDARSEPAPARPRAREARARGLREAARRRGGRCRSPTTAFDRYVSAGSIEYWPDPQRALVEAYRVLRSGGRALVIGPARPANPILRRLADTWMLFPPERGLPRLVRARRLRRRVSPDARAVLVPQPAGALCAGGQRAQAGARPLPAGARLRRPSGRTRRWVAADRVRVRAPVRRRLARGRAVPADRRAARAAPSPAGTAPRVERPRRGHRIRAARPRPRQRARSGASRAPTRSSARRSASPAST